MNQNSDKAATDYDLPLARRVAHVLGEQSAAAAAVAEYESRTAAGEDVAVVTNRRAWFVVPRTALQEAMGQ